MVFLEIIYKTLKKHWKLIILSILVILLLLYQLFWLLTGIIGVFLVRFILMNLIKLIKNKLLSKIVKGLTFFILIFIISISIKLFVFGIFKIPSSSMENTLYPDDIILVNKLIYGPKLPTTPFEIPWINFLFYLNENARSNMDSNWWNYQRFSGINSIEQGDVLVFQTSRTFFIVKRCIGLPGDLLKIINGEIYTNNKKFPPTLTVKEHYSITVKSKETFYNQLDSLKIEAMLYPSSEIDNEIVGILSLKEYNEIQLLSSLKSIKKKVVKEGKKENLFLNENSNNWTIDNMGAFSVPKKGFQIELNDKTVNLYKKTLQEFEKITIEKKEGSYFLNGKRTLNYIFKKDYIFVLGDNRKNSKDSRYIGFVPVESIVGKVQCILFSNYNDTFNWNRLFKGIN